MWCRAILVAVGLVSMVACASRALGAVEIFFPGPGHAPDNLMVWVPAERVLFGGCAVRAMAAGSLGNRAHADTAGWLSGIRRTLARYRDALVVVPGHGEPGGIELLEHTLALLETQARVGD